MGFSVFGQKIRSKFKKADWQMALLSGAASILFLMIFATLLYLGADDFPLAYHRSQPGKAPLVAVDAAQDVRDSARCRESARRCISRDGFVSFAIEKCMKGQWVIAGECSRGQGCVDGRCQEGKAEVARKEARLSFLRRIASVGATTPNTSNGLDLSGFDAYELPLTNPLKYGNIRALTQGVLNQILAITSAVMLIVLIIAGYRYLTAGANEQRAEAAKNAIKWSLIGIIVILITGIVVNSIIITFGK